MASGRMELPSQSIMLHTNFSFILPNDVEMEEVLDKRHYDRDPMNLILLHGLTGTDTDWLYGSMAQWAAIQYNLNIFMPTTGNSFYLDKGYMGANYREFITEELPGYIGKTFGIEMTRENSMIGGLSMGGYGSLCAALSHPEKFRACIALSSALITDGIAAGSLDGVVPPQMIADIFGDPEKLTNSDKNPEYLYKKLKKEGRTIPKIYFACGTEDSLIGANRKLRDFLSSESADFVFEEGPGRHDWAFWNEYLDRGIRAVLEV